MWGKSGSSFFSIRFAATWHLVLPVLFGFFLSKATGPWLSSRGSLRAELERHARLGESLGPQLKAAVPLPRSRQCRQPPRPLAGGQCRALPSPRTARGPSARAKVAEEKRRERERELRVCVVRGQSVKQSRDMRFDRPFLWRKAGGRRSWWP